MLSSRREYLIGGLCHEQRLLKLGRALSVLERGGRNDMEEEGRGRGREGEVRNTIATHVTFNE